MELQSSFQHLLQLLPLCHLFRMRVLRILCYLLTEFFSLEEPKLLPNFCPQLYGDRLLYGPTISILLCSVIPSYFCNHIAPEILLFDA